MLEKNPWIYMVAPYQQYVNQSFPTFPDILSTSVNTSFSYVANGQSTRDTHLKKENISWLNPGGHLEHRSFKQLFLVLISHVIKCHQNPLIRFPVMVLTDRQTDRAVMISNIFPLSKDQEQLSEAGIRGGDT